MSITRRVDVVVIGAGTAGLSAVDEIDRAGRSLLLVDHGPLGTTCIRAGCIPSKAVLRAGHRWSTGHALAKWDDAQGAAVRRTLWAEVRALRGRLVAAQVDKTREKLGDRLVVGTARFVAPDAIEVDGTRIEAGAFVIATGSSPVVPKDMAALGDDLATRVLTTDTLFDVETLPASIGIVGVGNVGIELGLAFARLGLRVVAVNKGPWPAGIVDPRIADRAIRTFGDEMTMRLGAEARVERGPSGYRLAIGDEMHGVDRVLAALGRKPNLDTLDLQRAGVTWDAEDAPIDATTLQLARAPIFVAGDASAERPLLHEATDEGVIAARGAVATLAGANALDVPARRTPLDIVFTDPDVVRIGASFDELDEAAVWIGTAVGSHNGRSAIDDSQDNLVRLYANRSDGRLLGGAAISVGGEHLAHLIALAIDRGLTVDELLRMPFYHPTFEELVQSALRDIVAQRAEPR